MLYLIKNKSSLSSNFIFPLISRITSSLISTSLIEIFMDYYCKCCDKRIKLNQKIIILNRLHLSNLRFIHINRSIKTPCFFSIDKIYKEYVVDHNKKLDVYLVECDSKIVLNDLTPHIETDFYLSVRNINLKSFLLYWIEYFILQGYQFLDLSQIKIKKFSGRRYMNFSCYIKQLMQMNNLQLNKIIAEDLKISNFLR